MKKRVLIITPRFPFLEKGACEQDRVAGIKMFLENGFEAVVICKALEGEMSLVKEFEKKLGIKIIPVTYKFAGGAKRLLNLLHWDGAAYEYFDKEIQEALGKELDSFKPDFVYFDYTFLWPLYDLVKKRKVPIITRSINFEPLHFLEEDGYSVKSLLMFFPKLLSEFISLYKSDAFFSISPNEQKIYKWLGKRVANLPLRGLPKFLDWEYKLTENKSTLDVFFAGSTYNVKHNKKALELILNKIAPEAEQKYPGKFTFNIVGGKFPNELKDGLKNGNIKYHGFVPTEEYDAFLGGMDIALIPSLAGAGMQQKVFEPLARGIPTITSERGLAGYGFKDGEQVLLAKSNDYLAELVKMQRGSLRDKLSKNSKELSKKIFSKEAISDLMFNNFPGAKEKGWEGDYYEIADGDFGRLYKEDWKIKKSVDYIKENLKSNEKILEVGCGVAGLADVVDEKSFYIGVDMSDFAIAKAKERLLLKKNVILIKADSANLPFEDKTFDIIYSQFALEHFTEPERALLEMKRVLKPGGVLILIAPNLELPLCYPTALRHKGLMFRLGFFAVRVYDYVARLFGAYAFRTIKENYLKATGRYEKKDDDLVYLASSFEVINFLKKNNFDISFASRLKRLFNYLPGLEYYGTELFVIAKLKEL